MVFHKENTMSNEGNLEVVQSTEIPAIVSRFQSAVSDSDTFVEGQIDVRILTVGDLRNIDR